MSNDKRKNIALVGMMGSGKSSVGKALKKLLAGYEIFEMDDEIESRENMVISEIFAQKGEAHFRNLETNLIKEIHSRRNLIVSTGGGAFLDEQNRTMLKETAFCVYLEVDAKNVYTRLKGDTTRPLLNCENPEKKIEELITQREKAYRYADCTVNVCDKNVLEIAQEILEKYKNYGN